MDDAGLLTLAVWDGRGGDGGGGTASCVRNWRARGHAPFIIDPRSGEEFIAAEIDPNMEKTPAETDTTRTLLTGEWLPSPGRSGGHGRTFCAGGGAAAGPGVAPARSRARPTVEETRYSLVFRAADVAARFAWRLQAWATLHGAPDRLRQGLHAGPVVLRPNALSGQSEPVGAHRARAASICRASAAGQVGVSRECVALLATENSAARCEYLGLRVCPPGRGTARVVLPADAAHRDGTAPRRPRNAAVIILLRSSG